MAINKVDLTVSQIINDLNSGLTWLKKDDLGYGSIEVKYSANEKQIAAIRKHPSLKNAETTITIFNIIDDTKNNDNSTSTESKSTKPSGNMEQKPLAVVSERAKVDSTEAADIFANL
jgi:trehalose/maltose hydrolase-like predicted phosphorylase